MVNYINYTTANISSFAGGYDYGAAVLQSATGFGGDVFAIFVLFGIFLVFTGITMRLGQERAFLYSSFITVIATAIMVSGGFLNPLWAAISSASAAPLSG